MLKNGFDKDGSAFELGLKAENSFVDTMKSKGWNVTPSTTKENMFEHWDYLIEKDDTKLKVDVKSEKKINRSDEYTQLEWIWIELQNVRGDIGWLYGSADYIAFQNSDSYLFIERETLVGIVESLIKSEYVTRSFEAKYKLYRRFKRQDLLTMIHINDIKNYCIEL